MLEFRMQIFALQERTQISDADRPQSTRLQTYLAKGMVEACAVGVISTIKQEQGQIRLKAG